MLEEVIAFVACTDPERARAFYQDVLGLELVADEPFALVFDSGGTMLRVQKVQSFTPAGFTALGWQVEDIEAAVDALVERGVSMARYDGLDQDARGIATFPGGARVAWFRDSEGNTLSLTQM